MRLGKHLTRISFKATLLLIMAVFTTMPFSSALYSDQEQSTDNSFAAHSLDITFTSAQPDFAPIPILEGDTATRSALLTNLDMPITYDQEYAFISGDTALCQNLQIKATYNWYNPSNILQKTTVYTGPLTAFTISNLNTQIPNVIPYMVNSDYQANQHWFDYQVSLIPNPIPGETLDPTLGNKTCNFDIASHAWMPTGTQSTGFHDTETINNTITTGSWAHVSGVKFADLDKDGNKDEGEPLLPDWTIFAARQIQQLTLDSTQNGVTSQILEQDKKYVIRAEGTFEAGDQITADAKYSVRSPNTDWTDTVQTYETYGTTLLDLQINNSTPDWGNYRSDHTYWINLTGTNAAVTIDIYDIYKPNNTGSLTVTIFEIMDETTTDETGKYTIDLTDITTEIIIGEIVQPNWTQSLPDYPGYYFIPEPDIYENYDFGNYQEEAQPDIEKIVINEFYQDVDNANEWVELYNAGTTDVNLSGWDIKDATALSIDTLPNVTLLSDQFTVIVTSLAPQSLLDAITANGATIIQLDNATIGNGLNTGGDRLELRKPDDSITDEVSWGSATSPFTLPNLTLGSSYQRLTKGFDTDAATDWGMLTIPNPGTNPHSHIVVGINQADNNLLISFAQAQGFDLVKYSVQYTHKVADETITEVIEGEATKPVDQPNLAIDPLYLGTCSSGGSCTPHTDIQDIEIHLLYKNGQDLLGSSTLPYTWTNLP